MNIVIGKILPGQLAVWAMLGFSVLAAFGTEAYASNLCPAQVYFSTTTHVKALSVKDYGAKGDGATDDTGAIQAAFNHANIFSIVVFPPGTYLYSAPLSLRESDVVVQGEGATLKALNGANEALFVYGNNDEINGLTIDGAGKTRMSTNNSIDIVLWKGSLDRVIGNTIVGGSNMGIDVSGAQNFLVDGNSISGTQADGIHVTLGAKNGIIENNTVSGNGDDTISVVSYQGDLTPSSNILIRNNTVKDNYWGRGLTVVGGSNVTISSNKVSGVHAAAGIYVFQEDSYNTFGVSNVLVSGNAISDIETYPWANGLPYAPAQHPAVFVGAGSGYVTKVAIRNNSIETAAYGGARIAGNVCLSEFSGNTMTSLKGTPLNIGVTNCNAVQLGCFRNTNNGVALPVNSECEGPAITGITGATTSSLPSDAITARVQCTP